MIPNSSSSAKLYKRFCLTIRSMRCFNQCRHCFVEGSPDRDNLPLSSIKFIIDQLVPIKKLVEHPHVYFLYEATAHPEFLTILDILHEYSIPMSDIEGTGKSCLETNGHWFAHCDDAAIERLKRFGFVSIELALHGLKETHDDFVQRKGAFDDVITAARRAVTHGFVVYWALFFTRQNLDEYPRMVELVSSIGSADQRVMGKVSFETAGRARTIPELRITESDLKRLFPDEQGYEKIRQFLRPEKESVKYVLHSPLYETRTVVPKDKPEGALFYVLDNFDVYDSRLLGFIEPFKIGNLKQRSLFSLLKDYQIRASEGTELLRRTGVRFLAEKYGDRNEDKLYYLEQDLIPNKWSGLYLTDTFINNKTNLGTNY